MGTGPAVKPFQSLSGKNTHTPGGAPKHSCVCDPQPAARKCAATFPQQSSLAQNRERRMPKKQGWHWSQGVCSPGGLELFLPVPLAYHLPKGAHHPAGSSYYLPVVCHWGVSFSRAKFLNHTFLSLPLSRTSAAKSGPQQIVLVLLNDKAKITTKTTQTNKKHPTLCWKERKNQQSFLSCQWLFSSCVTMWQEQNRPNATGLKLLENKNSVLSVHWNL